MNASTHSRALTDAAPRTSGQLARFAAFIMAASLLTGCGKGGSGASQSADPEMDARLVQLTAELHHTMAGRKLNRNFDEFIALSNLEVPPPPAGKKYSIDNKWKVVLVNK